MLETYLLRSKLLIFSEHMRVVDRTRALTLRIIFERHPRKSSAHILNDNNPPYLHTFLKYTSVLSVLSRIVTTVIFRGKN
jgi:hypothetical protein